MIDEEEFEWRNEFQYLLDGKILSRDELAYLFGQIQSIVIHSHIKDRDKITEIINDVLSYDLPYLAEKRLKELLEEMK
jgi:hypothetical protein